MEVCIGFPPSVFLSHATEALTPRKNKEKKLWVNMEVCIGFPPSVFLSHTTKALTPKKNKESYIFITECYGRSSIHVY